MTETPIFLLGDDPWGDIPDDDLKAAAHLNAVQTALEQKRPGDISRVMIGGAGLRLNGLLGRGDDASIALMWRILEVAPDVRLNTKGDTLALWMLRQRRLALSQKAPDVFSAVLSHPMLAVLTNADGETPLVVAAEEGNVKAIHILGLVSDLGHLTVRGVNAWSAAERSPQWADVVTALQEVAETAYAQRENDLAWKGQKEMIHQARKAFVTALDRGNKTVARLLLRYVGDMNDELRAAVDDGQTVRLMRLIDLGANMLGVDDMVDSARDHQHGAIMGILRWEQQRKCANKPEE